MKKALAIGLAAAMAVSMTAPVYASDDSESGAGIAKEDIKIGAIYIGDENEGYTAAHMAGIDEMVENLGLDDSQVIEKTLIGEDEGCYDAAADLADQGCQIIFANSFGHETYILEAAGEYPDVQFCHATGTQAASSGLSNMHNYFTNIYEARYVSGVVAGLKLNQMIEDGTITEDNCKMGYVGAFPYAEVISGYTSFYLGAKSVCPSVTMEVKYTNSWASFDLEKECADALISDGCAIIIITHKLQEVLALSDRVAILRKGQYIDTVETAQANVQSLSEMMVGARVDLNIERPKPENIKPRLVIEGVNCKDKDDVKTLDDVDLTVNTGEILGIAGISGSGQKELLEAIAGLQDVESGSIRLLDDNGSGMELSGMDSISINEAGISLAFVPEDRIGMGLVGDMDMTDNMMLRSYRNGKSPFLDRKGPRALAQKIKDQLEVMTPSISAPVRQMSGGNVQKVLVGREIAQNPKVLLVAFPTRGVDINTSHVIYQLLNEQKKKGVAVVCVIEDLDVVLELCDRIAVLCGGRISGVVDGRTATKEGIGLLMTKHEKGGAVNE